MGPARTSRRRPGALVGLGAILIVIAAIVGAVLFGGGDGEDTAAVSAALRRDAALLAGPSDASALAAATCKVVTDDREFECTPRGAPAQQAVRVVLRGSGTISRRLAGAPSVASLRSGDGLGAALSTDARLRGLGSADYACATSVRVSPQGEPETGRGSGFVCVDRNAVGRGAPAESKAAGTRYVELASGLVIRDYIVDFR